jgi:hypothetical protein
MMAPLIEQIETSKAERARCHALNDGGQCNDFAQHDNMEVDIARCAQSLKFSALHHEYRAVPVIVCTD